MKKLFCRIIAFSIDMLIVSVIILLLSSISFINPNTTSVNVLYNEMSTENKNYTSVKEDLEKFMDDGELVQEEYDIVIGKYNAYSSLFSGVGVKEEITNKKKDEIRANIDKKYIERMNRIQYDIARKNIYYSIIGIVVYLLYFGLLQWILKGQTIGKKLLKVKVVNKDDSNKRVPLWSFLIRSIFVAEILILGVDLILVYSLKINPYMTANYWISQFRYIYEMLFLIVMIIRDDQRSVHDLILNTRVMLMDKNKNEVFDVLFTEDEVNKDKEEVKEEKKDVKKTTEKKSNKKVKEVVVAEKVNDKKKPNKTN